METSDAANSPFVIGLLGATVALKFVPGLSWKMRAVNAISGAVCAGYVAPALCEWLRIASPAIQSAAAFAIGMYGLSLAAALFKAISEIKLAEVVKTWLERK